jgi:hypothetical protein
MKGENQTLQKFFKVRTMKASLAYIQERRSYLFIPNRGDFIQDIRFYEFSFSQNKQGGS